MTLEEINARLVTLYQEISEHTKVPCSGQGDHPCRVPFSCCDASVCELVIEQAKWDWNMDLPRTTHPKYPLMGDKGCTAPPHMRPLCAVHSCVIAKMGGNPKDPAWTERYWELRNEIDLLEWKKREVS